VDLQQADRTEEKRSPHHTESNRQRPRPAPRSHGTPRGSRRRHAAGHQPLGLRKLPSSATSVRPSHSHHRCAARPSSSSPMPSLRRTPQESHEARTRGGAARTPRRNVPPWQGRDERTVMRKPGRFRGNVTEGPVRPQRPGGERQTWVLAGPVIAGTTGGGGRAWPPRGLRPRLAVRSARVLSRLRCVRRGRPAQGTERSRKSRQP
jgi:hypothetical protein